MPLYEFECLYCGHRNLKRLSHDDLDKNKTRDCARCGEVMKRLFPFPAKPNVKGGTEKFHK